MGAGVVNMVFPPSAIGGVYRLRARGDRVGVGDGDNERARVLNLFDVVRRQAWPRGDAYGDVRRPFLYDMVQAMPRQSD